MSLRKKLKVGILVVVGLFVAMIVVGMIVGPKPKKDASAPPPATTKAEPQPSASPPPPTTNTKPPPTGSVASHMTKSSEHYGIPLPDDGEPTGDMKLIASRVGTVSDVTAFYERWMKAHRWTFDRKHSVMDPDRGVSQSLGYTTSQVWCRATTPITTAIIIVGSGDAANHGRYVQISVIDSPNEDSCP